MLFADSATAFRSVTCYVTGRRRRLTPPEVISTGYDQGELGRCGAEEGEGCGESEAHLWIDFEVKLDEEGKRGWEEGRGRGLGS